MELNPHDLLKIESVANLISYSPMPEWVKRSIDKAPFVVVRRARASEVHVAVGVRGSSRNERFAAFLPVDQIVRRITPEQLAQNKKWNEHVNEMFGFLERVSHLMNFHELTWGPVGSVGFELASGIKTITKTSDLDLVIRFSERFTTRFAKQLEAEFKKIQTRVDVQIETMQGSFSLSEYAISGEQPILLRTVDGPMLKEIRLFEYGSTLE